MDIFIEKLIKRKRSGKDYAITVAAVLLTLLIGYLFLAFFGEFFGLWLAVLAGLGFLCYRIISAQNIEFEYSLTNNELDIDKIISKRKRKHLITIDIKKIELLAPISSEQFKHESGSATITRSLDYSSGTKNANTYFAVFFGNDGLKSLLIFEPNEKMLTGIKRYIPNKVRTA